MLLSVALAAAAMPAAFPLDSGAGVGGDPVQFLYLKAASFDPLVQGVSWIPGGYRLAALDPLGDLYVVQFAGKILGGDREALLATGVKYHSYLPDNAFLVQATALQMREVVKLPAVRSVIAWEPFLRIDPDLRESAWSAASGPAIVSVENFGDPGRLQAFAAARGATVVLQDGPYTTVSIPRSLLVPIASLPTVVWVEPWQPRTLDNYNSAVIQGARQATDGAFSPSSLRMWSYNPATGLYEGTTGRNVTVAVSDTGLDTTHPDFNGKVVLFDSMGDPQTDTLGHGTHTAGTVLGNGAWRASDAGIAVPGKYAGIAPDAKLVVESIFAVSGSNAKAGQDNGITGAVISSNSWASGGSYDGDARQYDGLARDSWPDTTNASSVGPQSVLYFFSAGNAGGTGKAYHIASPSQGKNVISVGATGDNTNGVSWDTMAGFSSRGPASDDRIKPDLVAPGASVMSAVCAQSGCFSYGNQQGTSYGELSGTSMSCPGAAGAAAVAWQFYRDRTGREPTPDMMKAILINGVDEMAAYPVLGTDQGFGRINLSTSLLSAPNRMQIWMDRPASLATNDELVYTYPVADSTQPFVATLAWLDEPGDAGALPAIVNDLDLWVVGPSGEIYRGNSMDNAGNSLVNGLVDKLNTVEKVKVGTPTRGYYEVHVKGSNVPVGPQDFSLAIRGNVVTDWYDIILEKVQTNATTPIEGNVVSFNATLWNRGTQWVNGSQITLEANTPFGVSPVTTVVPGAIAPQARYNVTANWTTVRGNITFVARVSAPVGQTEFSSGNNQANKSFFVRGYGFTLQSDGLPAYAVNPGTTLSLTFNITQTGNVQDNISIALGTDNPSIPAYLDYTRLNVAPGLYKLFHLTVIVPPSSKAQERVNISIVTRSMTDARVVQNFQTYVTVNHLYGFSFSMAPNYTVLPPTGEAASSITIENRGNGPDTFLLTAAGIPTGWSFVFASPGVTLQDNESVTVAIAIGAPLRADAGARFVVVVRAASDGAPPQILNYTLNVSQVYGWSASAHAPAAEVAAGSVVEVPIDAQNFGNGVDEIVVEVLTPPGWQSTLTRPRLVLLPYGNLTSLARITVDQWALAGDYTVRVTFGGARNFTTATIPMHVKMVYALDVQGPGYTIQMGQGEVNTFEAVVVNQGNGLASVMPVVLAPDGVTIIAVVPAALLERNATARFTFQVIVARDAAPSLRNFTVDFRSGENDSVSNPIGLHIDVHEVVEPAPVVETPAGGGAQSVLIQSMLVVMLVVGAAVPAGYMYIRHKASKNAPPPQVIVQTVEDANSGTDYDPTRAYVPEAPQVPRAAPRAPRGAAQASPAMSIVGVCKNCGGGVVDLGNQMGRCLSCGVEQILRLGKR